MAASLSSLRYVGVAGAPIDKGTMEIFQALMHSEGLISQIWGMTEVGVVFQERYNNSHSHIHNHGKYGQYYDGGSVGRVLEPFYEVRIVDLQLGLDDADSVGKRKVITADNTPGELYVRGRMGGLFTGYLGGDTTRDECIDEKGWFRTGDVVCVRGGRYYVMGRVKELIKVRG
jgi:acyl-CoA synthetase (AMP-forming)/AMP-acid ligase II